MLSPGPLATISRKGLVAVTILIVLTLSIVTPVPENFGVVHAAVNQWSTGGPFGGEIQSIVVDTSTTPSTIYASTFGSGMFKSSADSAAWTRVNNGLNDLVTAMAVDPATNPATIYAGTAQSGIFKLSEGGSTWSLVTDEFSDPVNSIAVDTGTSPSTIYVGETGVFRFSTSATMFEQVGGIEFISRLAIDTSTVPSTIFAGTDEDGVFEISGGAATWEPVGDDPLQDGGVSGLVVDNSTSPSTLYMTSPGTGAFRLVVGDATWTPLNSGLNDLDLENLAIDSTTKPETVYAATDSGMFKITGSQSSWMSESTGLTGFFLFFCVTVDTKSSPSTIYAGSDGGGVFALSSIGSQWNQFNAGMTATIIEAFAVDTSTIPSTVYAGVSDGGVYRTTNGGQTWSPLNIGLTDMFVSSLAVDQSTNPSTIYASTEEGVFRMTAGASAWTPLNSGFPPPLTRFDVSSLAVDKSTSPATIYCGVPTFGVFKITSAQSSWTALTTTGLTNLLVQHLAVDTKTNPSTIYAGTGFSGSHVFKLVGNSGSAWSLIDNGLQPFLGDPPELLVDPSTSPSTIYLASQGGGAGVFATTNSGASWTRLSGALSAQFPVCIAVDSGTLYTGTFFGGIYKTTNLGASWTSLNDGLGILNVFSLAVDTSTTPHTIYAGTVGGGAFQNQVLCTSIAVSPATIPDAQVGMPYSSPAFTQTGGIGTVTLSETGALPAGLKFTGGAISGTPTQGGRFPITITAVDMNGCTGSRTLVLDVFDTCIQDDATGNMIQFNSKTGDYLFTKCGKSGISLSGTGTITTPSGILTLTDNKSDRRISAGFNLGSLTGRAIVILISEGVSQTFSLSQTNPHPSCVCPR